MNSCVIDVYDLMGFVESDNAIFDDMGALLSSYSSNKRSFPLAAPFNPSLETTVKLPLSESEALARKFARPVYAAVTYDDGGSVKRFYYFVEDAKRVANRTVALTLKMDTLNTYNLDGELAPTCYVTREHADRFSVARIDDGIISVHNEIDNADEGYAPSLFKTADTAIVEPTHNMDYFLIYKTRDDITAANLTNPVSCYLCPQDAVMVLAGGSGPVVTIAPADLAASTYYYMHVDGGAWEVTNGTQTFKSGDAQTMNYDNLSFPISGTLVGIEFYKTSGPDQVSMKPIFHNSVYGDVIRAANTIDGAYGSPSITLTKGKEYYSISVQTNQKSDYFRKNVVVVNSGTISDVYSKSFSAVDRADSKLIKIIDLPYCPVAKTIDGNGNWSFSGFEYDAVLGYWKATSVAMAFSASLPTGAAVSEFNAALTDHFDARTDKATFLNAAHFAKDPKKYNSSFYIVKFSYDTFSLSYSLETLSFDEQDATDVQMSISFKATNTINSNFLFTVSFGNVDAKGQTDYPNILLSTRNNEMPIFTNDYLNYLKTGYNYDKKSKAISASSSFISAGLSIATGVSAAAVGAATGNPITAAAGVSLIGSGVASISSAIASTIANENSLASKIAGLQAQATSTAGSDDLDLLKTYNGNRLRVMRYEASAEAMALFDTLFRCFGYKRAKYGVPDTTSRSWYNFAAANIVLAKDAGEVPADAFADETAKWAAGVTVYHLPLGAAVGYDIKREKENWEVAIVSAAYPG